MKCCCQALCKGHGKMFLNIVYIVLNTISIYSTSVRKTSHYVPLHDGLPVAANQGPGLLALIILKYIFIIKENISVIIKT